MNRYSSIFIQVFLLLFSGLSAQSGKTNTWQIEVRYIKEGNTTVFAQPSSNAEIIGHLYYLDKVLIISIPNQTHLFGWSKVIYPQKGFVRSELLLTIEEKNALDIRFRNNEKFNKYSRWHWNVNPCNKDYTFIKDGPNSSSKNIGILKEDDNVLFISEENQAKGLWTKIIYPANGFVQTKDIQMIKAYTQIALGFSYGAVNIPYEKNLTNHSNPLGGFIEISKSTWFVNIGIGYNYAVSNIAKYILKTNLVYLYLKFRLKLFNDNLELYTQAGAGYWVGNFQNTKYPSLTTYFPLEKDKGPAYIAGAGANYYFHGFFIGVQYLYWNPFKEAVFGQAPTPGSFTNQYKLFPGANYINAVIGYRLEL